jgi:hypothetical protein
MNKDINLIFEQYQQKILLNELDLGADYAAAGPEIKKRLREREAGGNDTYLFKILKDALGKDSDEVADILSKPLYDILFPGGKFAAMGDQKTQLSKLQNAIAANLPKVVEQLQQSEEYGEKLKNIKGLMSSAKHGYTARILRDFMSNVLQFIESETGGDEEPTEQEVHTAVAKAAKKTAAEATPEGEAPAAAAAEPAASQDPATTRITNWAFEEIDPVAGAPEQDVISSIQRKILSSGGLGMEEKSIVSKIKAVLNILVSSKVLERKAGKFIFGSNFDKFEDASDDTSNIGKDPLTIAQELGYKGSAEQQRYQRGSDYWSVQPD